MGSHAKPASHRGSLPGRQCSATLTIAPRLFCAGAATLLETKPYRVASRGPATMATRDDLPPSRSAKPIDPPPASGRPTTAQLKGDIASGRTGDKVGVFDPALAPLGTDDEAAGAPPSREAISMARRQERGGPAGGGGNAPQGGPRVVLYGFIAFIAVVALAFAGVLLLR